FERAPDGSLPHGWLYSRNANPTRDALEHCLAALEGGAEAAAFASGSAATMTVFQALGGGAHVVLPLDAYYGTLKLAREVFATLGISISVADMSDVESVRAAMRPETKAVWIETPSNPLVAVADIARLAAVAHAGGATAVVDNTWATPVLQRPFELGCDIVMHSTTKYLGGHGDVLGGALVTREANALWERIRTIQSAGGAVASPFDCWLVMRGVRTLPYRMRGHCANARAVAEYLAAHRAVERVHWPGLPADAGHEIASRQMSDYGGMLSVVVRGGRDGAIATAGRLELFTRATSLGGPESLVEHRASVEGPGTRAPEGLLRVSVGLEHPDDLIADLEQALSRA
ncbi:MAG TPA: aminotransferase class V-fold PLP-dependent enzyme, partial [Gemmatimonadaceae bacterium]|nr:aminotransferase class V-fold PLP-dependent enzyme [Gemmatimonadaceae bacterium]